MWTLSSTTCAVPVVAREHTPPVEAGSMPTTRTSPLSHFLPRTSMITNARQAVAILRIMAMPIRQETLLAYLERVKLSAHSNFVAAPQYSTLCIQQGKNLKLVTLVIKDLFCPSGA